MRGRGGCPAFPRKRDSFVKSIRTLFWVNILFYEVCFVRSIFFFFFLLLILKQLQAHKKLQK